MAASRRSRTRDGEAGITVVLNPFETPKTLGDSVPKPLGFSALAPEWLPGLRSGWRRPEPFRPLSRRSGRIPALPYPPPR
jgi:hypothetical protein